MSNQIEVTEDLERPVYDEDGNGTGEIDFYSITSWVDGDPTENGQSYRVKIQSGKGLGYIYKKHVISIAPPEFNTSNRVVKVGGITQSGVNGFYANIGDDIEISMSIVDDNGDIIAAIDQSNLQAEKLKIPLIKYADGHKSTILDKVYFDVTIIAGVATITGSFAASGDWKVTCEHTNDSLKAVNAGFTVKSNPITFLV